jgi:hypothetical protein
MASAKTSQKNNELTVEQVTVWRKLLFNERSLRVPVAELSKWPLSTYLWCAVFQAAYLDEQRDDQEQNWQTPAWDFGRFAKAHPALLEMDENEALRVIKKTIGGKFWEEHLHMDPADAEMAFDNIWVECRAVPGYDPLTIAIMEARKAIDEDVPPTGPVGYSVFLGVAQSLQRQLNNAPFMLPCHKLAPMLDCLPMTISRYRRKAIRDGHLKIVKEHSYRSATKGEATEFVFLAGQSTV